MLSPRDFLLYLLLVFDVVFGGPAHARGYKLWLCQRRVFILLVMAALGQTTKLMKMHLLRSAAAFVLSVVLCACPETTVPDGFGAGPVPLKPVEWEGTWSPVDEPGERFAFKVLNAEQGLLELRESMGEGKDEVFTLALRQPVDGKMERGVCFAILKDKKKPAGGLHLLRADGKGRSFLLWAIDHKIVNAALKAGELKGNFITDKDGDHNSLAVDVTNSATLLAPRFWNWTEPTIMVRR